MLSLKLLISTSQTAVAMLYLLLVLGVVAVVTATDKLPTPQESLFASAHTNSNAVNVISKEIAAIAATSNSSTLKAAIATTSNNSTLQATIAAATVNNATRTLHRGKRYLMFAKGARMSWRTTIKNNILKVNTLWGYGFGFRANFPFPGKEESRRPFFKRDSFHALEDILDGHGFDGRGCILKAFCTAILDDKSRIGGGMLFKLLKMLFRIGFSGKACILKAYCAAHSGEKQQGMIFKLLKYIFTLDSHDKRHFPYLRLENCEQILHSHCPLSFNNISPYTDDI